MVSRYPRFRVDLHRVAIAVSKCDVSHFEHFKCLHLNILTFLFIAVHTTAQWTEMSVKTLQSAIHKVHIFCPIILSIKREVLKDVVSYK